MADLSATLPPSYGADVRAIQEIDIVPTVLSVVCRLTGLGFAAVARVTGERWVACAVRDEIGFGLRPGGELALETTICHEIRQTGQLVAIDDVECDAVFKDHHTPRQYGFRSYISVPIWMADGTMFGTLCAIDPKPARVSDPHVIDTFRLFADLIAQHLHTRDQLRVSRAALATSERNAELQQQFAAILSHDLRNPLSAVQTAAKLLLQMGLDSRAENLAAVIDRSVVRMTGLIDNVLDFARVRLGNGLPMEAREEAHLAASFNQVIGELRTAHPRRAIVSDFDFHGTIHCDPSRLGQLLSNLVFNALTHGDPDSPVRVEADDRDGFRLAVSNEGPPIPADAVARLFLPFVRGTSASAPQGLGLGLYIAAEIARAHGGTLVVTSDDRATTFTFRMPASR